MGYEICLLKNVTRRKFAGPVVNVRNRFMMMPFFLKSQNGRMMIVCFLNGFL